MFIHLGAARLGDGINHISPRCLKTTYTYSAQNCLNAVVSSELFAYKMSCNVYAVKQGEMDDNMVIVNLTMLNIHAMDDLRFRLNFNLRKNNEIYHHS